MLGWNRFGPISQPFKIVFNLGIGRKALKFGAFGFFYENLFTVSKYMTIKTFSGKAIF